MNYRGLELKLRKIVEKRLKEGWELWSGGGRGMLDDGCCCLMGAVAYENGVEPGSWPLLLSDDVRSGAMNELKVNRSEAWSLESGFENWQDEHDNEFYRIGARIRRDYFVSR